MRRRPRPRPRPQAKSAILFLYRVVLITALPWLDEIVAASSPRRLPVVLTVPEVRSVLEQLNGSVGLVCALLYGTGMRRTEGLRVRIKDVEFSRRELVVRNGKGGKDRMTVLPENLILPLQEQIARARALHQRDLSEGFGAVWMPAALNIKYPASPMHWGWQRVFPSVTRSADPRTGKFHRHHLNEASVQRAMSLAAKRAAIVKPCDVSTTMIYTHVMNRGGRGVRSPLDQI
nr:integron integrase [uncultured bacterium]